MVFKPVKEKQRTSNMYKFNSKSNSENKNFSPLKVTIAPMKVSEKSDFEQKKPTKRKLFNKYTEEFVDTNTFDSDEENN